MWHLTIILCLLQISNLEASHKLDEFLRQYLQQKLTLDKARVNEAKDQIIPIAKILLDKLKEKDKRFDVRLEYRGSVYEKVKIKAPNEFDFDLVLLPLSLDREQENEMEEGVPIEYTTYKLSQSQQNEWKNMASPMDKSLLSAERVVATFANLVKQTVSDVDKEGKVPFQLNVKTNHPAVTISFMKNGKLYSDVDFAPVIEIKKWPKNLTSRWKNLEGNEWLPKALINSLIHNAPVYLVPKLFRDKRYKRRHLFWRYSFNRAEKRLLLGTDPGETNSCRRNVLRVLKGLVGDLNLFGLRSYYMKTVLLHESTSHPERSEWKDNKIRDRVLSAIRRLLSFVAAKPPRCEHYFIPKVNIFDKINQEQARQIVQRLRKFLENPESALKSILCYAEDGLDGKRKSKKLKRSCSIM